MVIDTIIIGAVVIFVMIIAGISVCCGCTMATVVMHSHTPIAIHPELKETNK